MKIDPITFAVIKSGKASNAPITPHNQAKKIRPMKIKTGFNANRRPSTYGVTAYVSIRCNRQYAVTGRIPRPKVSKASRPANPTAVMPRTEPIMGTKLAKAATPPHISAFGMPSK